MRVVSEQEFAARLQGLRGTFEPRHFGAVTGPGRSGAIAAAYASHAFGIPFVPYGQPNPGPVWVIDTASKTGATLRKAARRYGASMATVLFNEATEGRVKFWYEVQP